jgi:hypothetical protein
VIRPRHLQPVYSLRDYRRICYTSDTYLTLAISWCAWPRILFSLDRSIHLLCLDLLITYLDLLRYLPHLAAPCTDHVLIHCVHT